MKPNLWILTPPDTVDAAWVAAHMDLLSPDEQERYHRYLRDSDRELFLTAHIFARKVLSLYATVPPGAWTFRTNQHGRPEITTAAAPKGLRFNLAHTAGMVAMLVHDHADGGVDVEHIGNVSDPAALSNTVFADTEHRDFHALHESHQERRFYTLWTLKESFIKAKGKGLAIPLKDFAFTGLDEPRIRVECADRIDTEPDAWQFTVRQPSPGFVVATAYRGGRSAPDQPVSVFDVSGGLP